MKSVKEFWSETHPIDIGIVTKEDAIEFAEKCVYNLVKEILYAIRYSGGNKSLSNGLNTRLTDIIDPILDLEIEKIKKSINCIDGTD